MQKEDGNDSRLENALALWQNAAQGMKKGKRMRGLFPLAAVFLAGVIATGGAFLLFDEHAQSGNFTMASTVLEDWVTENHALSVFLGLDEENDHAKDAQAQESIP